MLTDMPKLDPVMAGLQATPPYQLPFAKNLEVRAFLLARDEGDVLVYSAPTAAGLPAPTLQLLNHWHEGGFAGGPVGAPVLVHEGDLPFLPDEWASAATTFGTRRLLADDLWAIPTPGHTPGATAYLWDSGRQRFLFTGDTVYLRDDEWVGAVLDSSDREAYVDSLGVLAALDFDVLVPWAATRGRSAVAPTDRADAHRRLDALRRRIEAGEDG